MLLACLSERRPTLPPASHTSVIYLRQLNSIIEPSKLAGLRVHISVLRVK